MRYRPLMLLLLLLPAFCPRAIVPTTMQVVDLRGIAGQPELETWLGSLQGVANRKNDGSVVYLVRNGIDASLADAFISMYHLRKETFTPGALLATMKPTLTGQVLYSSAQPWTRNIALTAAAVADGQVIASDTDIGLPTVLDLRDRWADRKSAYDWSVKEYGGKVDKQTIVLTPESGNMLADLIVSQKMLAVDLSIADAGEKTMLTDLIRKLPAGGRLIGSLDDRSGDADTALWSLTLLLGNLDRSIIPARSTVNLSCFACFPFTRPLLQSRYEASPGNGNNNVVMIYDGGKALDGSQSLDFALRFLPSLLEDSALADLPVGIETPASLIDFAPGVYQYILARQRNTSAELIAAPNGDGWALPMAISDPQPYLKRSGQKAAALDMTSLSFYDVGGKDDYGKLLSGLFRNGFLGAFSYPIAPDGLADRQRRETSIMSQCTGFAGVTHVSNVAELRATLTKLTRPFNVIYLDPYGLPPSKLINYLSEINAEHNLMTPSQALRAMAEYAAITPWLQAKIDKGIRKPGRDKPTLRVSVPAIAGTKLDASTPIPVTVRVTGKAAVLVARLIYATPHGRIGSADLLDQGDGTWKATLPPTLVGGQLTIRARVVEKDGFGVTTSEPLTMTIPKLDSDEDGLENTAEEYFLSDPDNWDTDNDGLADGFDPEPAQPNRDTVALAPSIFPPADKPWLASAGASTADTAGRHIAAGNSVNYILPLRDIPNAPAALLVWITGSGSVCINAGEPISFEGAGEIAVRHEIPLSAVQMTGKELQVKFSAGDKPLTLISITLISNPKGPYIYPIILSPAYPQEETPIFARATVYSPRPLKAVRLKYGANLNHLTILEMGQLEGTSGSVFAETIPQQHSGTILLYGIEAEDVDGNISAGPYQAMPIGQTRKPTLSFIGSRDLLGSWEATPIWGSYGRSLIKETGEDKATTVYPRSGKQFVWILAQPVERAIQVKIIHRASLLTDEVTLLNKIIPAGNLSGWFNLGSFNLKDKMDIDISVAPVGKEGYCAYGMVILTQDELFKPPLAHSGLDWYNTLTFSGVKNGDIVKGKLTIKVHSTGNVNSIAVTASQKTALTSRYSTDDIVLAKLADGSFTLDTRKLPPGDYVITAYGMKIIKDEGRTKTTPFLSTSVRITIPISE